MDDSLLSDSAYDDRPIADDDTDLILDDDEFREETNKPRKFVSSVVDQDARDEVLKSELEQVRRLNNLISSVNTSLEGAMANMATVSNAVNSANTLLDLYIRVLSQSTHNSRLILNGRWQGSTVDIQAIEAETQNRIYEQERRKAAEVERRAAAEAAREREEQAREAAARKETEPKRLRGTGLKKTAIGSRSTSSQSGNYGTASSSTTGIPVPGTTRGVLRGRFSSRGTRGTGRSTTTGSTK